MAMAGFCGIVFVFFLTCTSSAIARISVPSDSKIAGPGATSSQGAVSRVDMFSTFLPKRWRLAGFHMQAGTMAMGQKASARNGSVDTRENGDGNENDEEQEPAAVRWLTGMAMGIAVGMVAAMVSFPVYQVVYSHILHRPKRNRPVVFQRKMISPKFLSSLEKEGALDNLELLGKGGTGAVFKACLENGRAVAIKKVSHSSCDGDTILGGTDGAPELTTNAAQVHAEISTLGQVRHRNLVTLMAYIPMPNFHMLVYDYMENGSLHDVLVKVDEGRMELPWPMRQNIAVSVASGLKYLHFDCEPTIIHRDVKPGNILLDHGMEAHLGDFGIAKELTGGKTHHTSGQLAGTVGYIAPEYHRSLRYTTKGDVYAFGVVLVVLLTGREPSHDLFSAVFTHMGTWVRDVLGSGQERAISVLDSHLSGHGFDAQMLLAFKIAAFCLDESQEARPTSRDVLEMLNQIQ